LAKTINGTKEQVKRLQGVDPGKRGMHPYVQRSTSRGRPSRPGRVPGRADETKRGVTDPTKGEHKETCIVNKI